MKAAKLILLLSLGLSSPVRAVDDHVHSMSPNLSMDKLGKVNFPISCNAAAQNEFNRGMALFHSFWFEPAKESFTKVLKQDSKCGMAHWGLAIMSMGNPFTWASNPQAAKAGAPAAAEAQRLGAKSPRENDYIAAMAKLFKDWEKVDFRTRALEFEKAMGQLVAKYPDDEEASILYALSLNVTALPSDKTFANQLKAAAILEPLFKKYPQHPGVPHYLIHTYDYAGLADKGVPAARSYARIAPAVPHALHMPSHIFSRLGLWQEMVDSNRDSYEAAKAELQGSSLGLGSYDALHAMDYMVFGHLQQAQDKAAKQIVDQLSQLAKIEVKNGVAAYALAAVPARYALERGDWKQAAALKPVGENWSKFPESEAILVFARGLGAARSGDIEAAREDVKRLQGLRDKLLEAKNAYWAGQTDIQVKALRGWLALAENRKDESLSLLRDAADAEDASDKHPVTPGNVIPARTLLAELLLELKDAEQARREFDKSLKRDPNRFRTLYGAARAAEISGHHGEARDFYTKLQALTANRDSERPEIALTEAFLKDKPAAQL